MAFWGHIRPVQRRPRCRNLPCAACFDLFHLVIRRDRVMLSAGKGGRQRSSSAFKAPTPQRRPEYAKQAEKLWRRRHRLSASPGVTDDKALLAYYQDIGKLRPSPVCPGRREHERRLLVEMYKTIPTMRYVKDEAGIPLERIAEIRQKTDDKLKVFSGGGAATMITEMERASPAPAHTPRLADVFSSAYDLWHAGKKRESFDMFGRIQAFASITSISSIDIWSPAEVSNGYHDPRRASGWARRGA